MDDGILLYSDMLPFSSALLSAWCHHEAVPGYGANDAIAPKSHFDLRETSQEKGSSQMPISYFNYIVIESFLHRATYFYFMPTFIYTPASASPHALALRRYRKVTVIFLMIEMSFQRHILIWYIRRIAGTPTASRRFIKPIGQESELEELRIHAGL